MTTELIWQHHEAPGWEHVRVMTDHPGWTVFDSILVREHAGQVLRGGYTLVTDKEWRALELRLMIETSPGAMEGIHLLSEGQGRWTDADENHMPQLDGCLDLDIQWSPLTNSLPINRIPLREGEESEIQVAYISLPQLAVTPITQRYLRLNDSEVRYISGTRDFESEITHDEEGYVVSYPTLFSRAWPA
jgi:uncharacterized protein